MKQDASRWSRLFGDLESQADALTGAEELAEIAERTRIETGRLCLVDRLRPAEGHLIQVRCAGHGALSGRLHRVGADWLLLTESAGSDALIPIASVVALTGLGRRSEAAAGRLECRLGLRSALRGLVRDRAPVQVILVDGGSVAGTIDRVGVDFLELAEHPVGEPRRASSVQRVWTLPLHGVGVVRRAGS